MACPIGAIIFFLAGCSAPAKPIAAERFLLDTLVSVKSYDRPRLEELQIKRAIDAALKRMSSTGRALDVRRRGGEAWRLTRDNSGKPRGISSVLFGTLATAEKVKQLTGGGFDPAVGAATRLWRFEGRGVVPEKKELAAAVSVIGQSRIKLDPGRGTAAISPAGSGLDLGGVAKGMAVDLAVGILRSRGLKSAIVTTVSSTRVTGPKPGGRPWLIGIESPRPKTTPGLIGVIPLKKGSISTSGDYQRFFIQRGRRYHHIIDPSTGRPARGFMSVTVATDRSAAFADALSTGLAVMGREKAMDLVDKLPGVEAVFVDDHGKVWVSAGLKGKVKDLVARVR